MSLLLNLIWVILGGGVMALLWLLAAILMALTIVLLPWSRAALEIASYSFWPFGREAIDRRILTGQEDVGTGPFGLLGNILWFLFAGWWLALGHIVSALACAVTIIGLPLAWAHLKLAALSLAPIGKTVVDIDLAEEARRRYGGERLNRLR